jgi:two-component system response regulator
MALMAKDVAATKITIALADDDPDDRVLVREALTEARVPHELVELGDGTELLAYLRSDEPLPHLVLLDLNMPRMDGREALQAIRRDDRLRAVPVIILTTSRDHEDVVRTYELGANSFITKPNTFPGLVDVMGALDRYWIKTVEMPANR